MTATLETTATPSAISNNNLAEAFAELAGLITAWAHLPAVHHGSFTMHGTRAHIDLWFAEPEHVTAWANAFGVEATESDSVHETEQPFTVTEAELPDRYIAHLELTHLRYRDQPTAPTDDDTDMWEPSDELVKALADYTADTYGPSARLAEVALLMDTWAETDELDDGQQETLAEAVRDELAARDNGQRR